ncbi:ShlB/FhaC/HecB family hemolysin secretion/activation protein [Kalamiella sp. sgz302252]|uniref:ShlB/FhaC/HecB family hemolysin secretion/activation protein n=1 Tax=Pantoea sp. sgz302252 TaxID=3341827 RepID=UPI0036D2ED47
MNLRKQGYVVFLLVSFFFPSASKAKPSSVFEPAPVVSQQQKQQALESLLNPAAKAVHLFSDLSRGDRLAFPSEKKCFFINNIQLEDEVWLPAGITFHTLIRQAENQCLGGQGINLLMSAMQNRLVEQGYITARVMAPPQNLTSGTLRIKLVEGKIGQVKLAENSDRYIQLYTTFPSRSEDSLNLRDIEQGLENLQRLSGTQAAMKIIPGVKPGESDIEVTWRQDKPWRINFSLDDAGAKSTGHYQGSGALSINNPFSLSDLFYISASTDLHGGDKSSKNITAHYSIPFGYWMFGTTAYDYRYQQKVSASYIDFRYSGWVKNITMNASRVIYRGRSHKTSFSYDLLARQSGNAIEDVALTSQARHTAAWRLGLQHRHYVNQATMDAGLSYQQGTRWFGAVPSPEERSGDATALSKIVTLNLQLNLPFQLARQTFRYNTRFFQQFTATPLTSPEQFSIGNRWTVRGFDGERTLMASRGWFWRNDMAWKTPLPSQELYLAIDSGGVSGPGSEYLSGNALTGGQVGIRGNAFKGSYDLFAGMPFSKPDGFQTSRVTLGFNLNWSY